MVIQSATRRDRERERAREKQRQRAKDLFDTSNKNDCHFSTEIESPEEIQITHIRQTYETRLYEAKKWKGKENRNRCKTAILIVKKKNDANCCRCSMAQVYFKIALLSGSVMRCRLNKSLALNPTYGMLAQICV